MKRNEKLIQVPIELPKALSDRVDHIAAFVGVKPEVLMQVLLGLQVYNGQVREADAPNRK